MQLSCGRRLLGSGPSSDSISELAFHPKANYLAASSWDQKVRVYEIDDQGNSKGVAMMDFQAPALAVAWSPVGQVYECDDSYLGN